MTTVRVRSITEWLGTVGAGLLAVSGSTLLLVWHLQEPNVLGQSSSKSDVTLDSVEITVGDVDEFFVDRTNEFDLREQSPWSHEHSPSDQIVHHAGSSPSKSWPSSDGDVVRVAAVGPVRLTDRSDQEAAPATRVLPIPTDFPLADVPPPVAVDAPQIVAKPSVTQPVPTMTIPADSRLTRPTEDVVSAPKIPFTSQSDLKAFGPALGTHQPTPPPVTVSPTVEVSPLVINAPQGMTAPHDADDDSSSDLLDAVLAGDDSQADPAAPSEVAAPKPTRQPAPAKVRVGSVGTAAFAWPEMPAVQQRLDSVATDPVAARLVGEIRPALESLTAIDSITALDVEANCVRLRGLADRCDALSAENVQPRTAEQLQRLAYAVRRRAEVITALSRLERVRQVRTATPIRPNPTRLTNTLASVSAYLTSEPTGQTWISYLELESLTKELSGDDANRSRLAAARTLLRMDGPNLTADQRLALTHPRLAMLRTELLLTATGGIDAESILAASEAVETREAYARKRLAWQIEALQQFPDAQEQAVGDLIATHHANANVRVAMSAAWIARLLPATRHTAMPIRESIHGADIAGNSMTTTQLGVRLIPSEGALNFALAARGTVLSETAASRWPATFYSDGRTWYEAARVINFDGRNIRTMPSEVRVHTDAQTRGLQTNFDEIPLLGSLVRDQAFRIHDEEFASAKTEIDARISHRIQGEFDRALDQQLSQGADRLNEKAFAPLERLGLTPNKVALTTTSERLIARYRIAGEAQLGGDSPRPLALAESEMSMQVHQSLLENALERSGLFGVEHNIKDLIGKGLTSTGQQPGEAFNDIPDNIGVELAEHDGAHIDFVDGRVEIKLTVRRISENGRTKYRNFIVRTAYRPVQVGNLVELQRDGVIMLEARVPLAQQVALRAIFNKVFAESRRIPIIPAAFASDPRLAGLSVAQCDFADGWMAISLVATAENPNVVADRSRFPTRR